MSNKPTIKAVLEAIGLLKNTDPAIVSALVADDGMAKSLGQTSETLRPGEHVDDLWLKGNTNKSPTREELKIGPGEEASGGGAEKMIGDYSNPARQMHGIEQVAERFGAMFDGFGRAMKAMMDAQKANFEATTQSNQLLKAILVKATEGEEEEEEEDEEEESEVVEINAARGKSYIAEAKKLLRKAATLKADMEDMDDKAEKKTCKAEIKKLVKSAIKKLLKARNAAYAAKSAELKKSIHDLMASHEISKADINVVQEEEEEEEDEEEEEGSGKSATAAAAKAAAEKAKHDDKGNQADKLDPATGNQDAAAKAAADLALKSKLEDALNGIGVLQTTVSGLMDVVAGKTKLADMSPVVKAETVHVDTIYEKILAAEDSGMITDLDAFAARDIASKIELAKSGKYDMAFVNDRISKTSSAVKALFADTGLPAAKAA